MKSWRPSPAHCKSVCANGRAVPLDVAAGQVGRPCGRAAEAASVRKVLSQGAPRSLLCMRFLFLEAPVESLCGTIPPLGCFGAGSGWSSESSACPRRHPGRPHIQCPPWKANGKIAQRHYHCPNDALCLRLDPNSCISIRLHRHPRLHDTTGLEAGQVISGRIPLWDAGGKE